MEETNTTEILGGVQITDATYWENLFNEFIDFVPTIIGAFAYLIIGLKIAKFLTTILKKILRRNNCDESVVGFVSATILIILRVFIIIYFIRILGIETTSFVAALGAAGLAIGLALQGTLQNFAGGVIVLVLKPFKVGDLVEFGGEKGFVAEINIFNTVINKPTTNEILIVPNSSVASSSLVNWSNERTRRIESPFSIAYGEDIAKVRALVLDMASKDERVLKDIACEVVVVALADSSVNLELRVWVNPVDFFAVQADMLEKIYNLLNAEGVVIPFPQLDVNVKN